MSTTTPLPPTAPPPTYQVPDWENAAPPTQHHTTAFKSFRESLTNGHANGHANGGPPAAAAAGAGGAWMKPQGLGLRQRFDRLLPPNKPILRLSRTLFLLLLALFICLLILIIGLAVGLSTHGKSHRFLPLPGTTTPITGDLTYYAPGLGACGVTSASTDMICAVSHYLYDAAQVGSNPNTNPLCGRKIRVTRNGKSVDVTVVDRCVGCQPEDVDLSPSAFGRVALEAEGRVKGVSGWL